MPTALDEAGIDGVVVTGTGGWVAGMMTAAVGLITEAKYANEIVTGGDADLVLLALELLREPYWALKAQQEFGAEAAWPISSAMRSNSGRSRKLVRHDGPFTTGHQYHAITRILKSPCAIMDGLFVVANLLREFGKNVK